MRRITDKIKHLIAGDGLKALAMKGGFWIGLGSGSEQGLRFIRNIILVRILAPEAFGLMAIILAVNAAFEAFTQIGIKDSVIQNPQGAEDTYLNGAWFMSFGRSILLFIIGIISSTWIANFYDIPQKILLLQVSFIAILFNGAMSVRAYVSLKHMDYTKWVMIAHGGGLIGILTTISLSYVLQNVWALIFGYLTEAAARLILSYILCPHFPHWRFNKEHTSALLKYARGMFGLPILYFIYAKTDIFVVGKMFPNNELGIYSMVVTLAQAPASIITSLVNPILLPAFSHKQNDKQWINNTIIKTTKIIMVVGLPLLFFTALYGREILTVIYGSPYATMAVPFVVHLAATIIRSASIPVANVYFALGRPEQHRIFTGIRATLILVLIYPAIRWLGLTGAALSVFFATAVGLYFQALQIRNLTGLDILKFKYILYESSAFSLIVGLVWIATTLLASSSPVISIVQGLIGCILGYGLLIAYMINKKVGLFK